MEAHNFTTAVMYNWQNKFIEKCEQKKVFDAYSSYASFSKLNRALILSIAKLRCVFINLPLLY